MKSKNTPDNQRRVFTPGVDWDNNACVNCYGVSIDLYSRGYKEAADLLVEHVMATHSSQDSLVYPIAFLYRHHLELDLKGLLMMCKQIQNGRAKCPVHHNIECLWSEVRSSFAQICPDYPDDLAAIEPDLREFIQIDPNATTFRYPASKSGRASLPCDIKLINIRHLKETLRSLSERLSALGSALGMVLEGMVER
jgi:hypothetical protein